MPDLNEIIKLVFARVADFFEILDLSILLSGIAVISGIYYWFFQNDILFTIVIFKDSPILLHLIICYLVGLICFASGRNTRRFISKVEYFKLYSTINNLNDFTILLENHGLQNHASLSSYLPVSRDNVYSLLAYLWSDVRQDSSYGYSLSFLKKYWSMSIAFDSLLFATFFIDLIYVDLCFGFIGKIYVTNPVLCVTYIFISFIVKLSLIKSACTYDRYQNEELIASFAVRSRNHPNTA